MNRSNFEAPIGDALDQVLGYLNFSSGIEDKQFLKNLNAIFEHLAKHRAGEDGDFVGDLHELLEARSANLSRENGAFRNIEQAQHVIRLALDELPDRYYSFHSDLLFHQPRRNVLNSFLIGRFFEAVLQQGGPWTETDRLVDGAIETLK